MIEDDIRELQQIQEKILERIAATGANAIRNRKSMPMRDRIMAALGDRLCGDELLKRACIGPPEEETSEDLNNFCRALRELVSYGEIERLHNFYQKKRYS